MRLKPKPLSNEALFRMSEATKKAAEYWSSDQSQAPGNNWVGVPGVVENMNQRATGDPAINWINHSAALFLRKRIILYPCKRETSSRQWLQFSGCTT